MSTITTIRPATTAEWETVCHQCEYATFFHTPYWHALFNDLDGFAIIPAAQHITFADNATAIVPLSQQKKALGILTVSHSSPATTFGGWISPNHLTPEHLLALRDYLRSCHDLIWRENPYAPLLNTIDIGGSYEDFTQSIDLRQELAFINQNQSPAHTKALRKAEREQVTIKTTATATDWELYYQLYQSSRVRWKKRDAAMKQSSGYPRLLFERLSNLAPDQCRLFSAWHNSGMIAGVICLSWNHHTVTWHGAASGESFNLRPNNLLYDTIIRQSHAEGRHWIDFNPAGGHEGVVTFKEHLGAQRLQSRVVNQKSLLRKIISIVR